MRILSTLAITIALSTPAWPVEVLKNAPGPGQLRPGQTVYVESRSCGKGNVMMLTGGGNTGGNSRYAGHGEGREKSCVQRPS